jgi:hypothetical protein
MFPTIAEIMRQSWLPLAPIGAWEPLPQPEKTNVQSDPDALEIYHHGSLEIRRLTPSRLSPLTSIVKPDLAYYFPLYHIVTHFPIKFCCIIQVQGCLLVSMKKTSGRN